MKDGKPLPSGGYYRRLVPKLYQKRGCAQNVADANGGTVVEAFAEVTPE